MCISYETSIFSFLVGTGFSILNLIKYRNIPIFVAISLFWLFVIFMQLWDALLWKNIIPNVASKLAMVFNILQPVVVFLVLVPLFLKSNASYKNIKLIVIGIIFFIYATYVGSHLKWDYGKLTTNRGIEYKWWSNFKNNQYNYGGNIYLITVILIFYMLTNNQLLKWSQILLFYLSLTTAYWSNYYPNENPGSIWCFFAAFVPSVNYFIFNYLKNNTNINRVKNKTSSTPKTKLASN